MAAISFVSTLNSKQHMISPPTHLRGVWQHTVPVNNYDYIETPDDDIEMMQCPPARLVLLTPKQTNTLSLFNPFPICVKQTGKQNTRRSQPEDEVREPHLKPILFKLEQELELHVICVGVWAKTKRQRKRSVFILRKTLRLG